MAEYIEREAAIRVVNGQSSFTMTRSSLIDSIGKLPAADVAPVVRCKGCKHSWEDIGGLCCGYGPLVDSIVPEDFFCAYGKPKEGANVDDHD